MHSVSRTNFTKSALTAIALAMAFCHPARAQHKPGVPVGPPQVDGTRAALREALRGWAQQSLRIADVTLQPIEPRDCGNGQSLEVRLANETHVVLLEPFTMRAPGCQLLVQDATGALIPTTLPQSMTYRGRLADDPESLVAASIIEGRPHMLIVRPGGDAWHVQPVQDELARTLVGEVCAVYRSRDVIGGGGRCGVGPDMPALPRIERPHGEPPPGEGTQPPDDGGLAGSNPNVRCQIAFDADVEYYQANGSSVAATVADIEMIMNHVGLIYQAQVAISYVETGIIVRTAEPDPYSSSDRDVLLCQLRNEWNANIAIPRDTAHLFTGKDINGSPIGYAYRGVICFGDAGGCNGGSAAYGFSQSRWTTDLTSRIELTAHELGHNWDCCHCDESSCTGGGPDPDCGIMNSFVNGSLTFEQRGLASITAWRNNANCVDPWFNPLYVNWSYSGPENGSAAQPFNTVAEGSVNALVGGEIRLTPGNYPENLTLQHIVTLKRNGASGIVRIGTP